MFILSKEEKSVKKRKIEVKFMKIPIEILYEIANSDCFDELFNLKDLTITNTKLYSGLFDGKCLQNLQNLEILYIRSICNEYILNYISNLTNLKQLSIFEVDNSSFLQNLINLESLLIQGHNLKDKAINSTISDKYFVNLKQLEHLEISDCENITEEYLYFLQNLKTLDVGETNIMDKHLFQLKQLQSLKVNYCKNITGEFLLHLNKLKDLSIMGINLKQEYLELLKNIKHVTMNEDDDFIDCKDLLFK
ncbi:hypothetical protein ABK040_006373 [Willaertia magna]